MYQSSAPMVADKELNIVAISGSTREGSSNRLLIQKIASHVAQYNIYESRIPLQLPIFGADLEAHPLPEKVVLWRNEIREADAVLFCIPEYLHNLPAIVKNCLEWLTSSGELAGKKIIAMTFTPHPPRGERAMQSLLWSLSALDGNVVCKLALYATEVDLNSDFTKDLSELIREMLGLLTN